MLRRTDALSALQPGPQALSDKAQAVGPQCGRCGPVPYDSNVWLIPVRRLIHAHCVPEAQQPASVHPHVPCLHGQHTLPCTVALHSSGDSQGLAARCFAACHPSHATSVHVSCHLKLTSYDRECKQLLLTARGCSHDATCPRKHATWHHLAPPGSSLKCCHASNDKLYTQGSYVYMQQWHLLHQQHHSQSRPAQACGAHHGSQLPVSSGLRQELALARCDRRVQAPVCQHTITASCTASPTAWPANHTTQGCLQNVVCYSCQRGPAAASVQPSRSLWQGHSLPSLLHCHSMPLRNTSCYVAPLLALALSSLPLCTCGAGLASMLAAAPTLYSSRCDSGRNTCCSPYTPRHAPDTQPRAALGRQTRSPAWSAHVHADCAGGSLRDATASTPPASSMAGLPAPLLQPPC